MLILHRRLLDLRRREVALQLGDYTPAGNDGDVFAYVRHEQRRLLVAVNLGPSAGRLRPEHVEVRGRVILGTDRAREGRLVEDVIEVSGDEAVIVELEG